MEFNELSFKQKREFVKSMEPYPNTDIRNILSNGIFSYEEVINSVEDLTTEMIEQDLIELSKLASKSKVLVYADDILDAVDVKSIVGGIVYHYDIDEDYLEICSGIYVYRDSIQ